MDRRASALRQSGISQDSDQQVADMVNATVPIGRQGTPEQIAAAAVAWLASPDASYIAGHALVIDDGLTAVR